MIGPVMSRQEIKIDVWKYIGPLVIGQYAVGRHLQVNHNCTHSLWLARWRKCPQDSPAIVGVFGSPTYVFTWTRSENCDHDMLFRLPIASVKSRCF